MSLLNSQFRKAPLKRKVPGQSPFLFSQTTNFKMVKRLKHPLPGWKKQNKNRSPTFDFECDLQEIGLEQFSQATPRKRVRP